ncbi:DUF368 domain-containing protein [Dokdonia sp. Hel_I_53]|uniref:DUF368 domain-containing protein n=1 Tax=Dokdonia sp. Hel_I_53 TaxID=1566287 RepID=UPI00119B0DDF|nr:DUF368 domain-containing protein [Dokdonia sp. Hel_I_53]TVZ50929.1 putative membrane protein [Dokdonia sp. Hel_I_53]
MSKSSVAYLYVLLKGMAMGAADVVPGVSGGTIAFISGIYQELIETIDKIGFGVFKTWKKKGFNAAVDEYNLKFLGSLFLGVIISILSLARLFSFLLEAYPILVWSFFFGLVLASILYIGKQIIKWTSAVIISTLLGAVVAYIITVVAPSEAPDVWYFYLLSGCIAIIAMILPGISGSFILVLLGSYAMVLGTITDVQDAMLKGNWELLIEALFKILLFGIGCIIGLKIFSKALKWMFENKKEITLAILTGFMIGSLNKLWPWKEVLSTRIDSHGKEAIVEANSILPYNFDGDPQIVAAIISAFIGFALILLLERIAGKKKVYAD